MVSCLAGVRSEAGETPAYPVVACGFGVNRTGRGAPAEIRGEPPFDGLEATPRKPETRTPRPESCGRTSARLAFGLFWTLFLAAAPVWAAGFRIEYLPARNPAETEVLERLRSSDRLHRIVLNLGDFLRLPFPVLVEVGGPAEGPSYDVSTRTIGLPYTFLVEATESRFAAGEAGRERLILDLAAFVFCHEVGHVLIHALGLHGRIAEEPAADDLALLLVAEVLGEGAAMAQTLDAWWARNGRLPREPYEVSPEEWREEERRRRILCLLWGSEPGNRAKPDAGVAAEDAADCRAAFLHMREDWLEALTPLLRRPR